MAVAGSGVSLGPSDRNQALAAGMNGFLRKAAAQGGPGLIDSGSVRRSASERRWGVRLGRSRRDLALKNDVGPAKLEYLFQKLTFDVSALIAETSAPRSARTPSRIFATRPTASAVYSVSSGPPTWPKWLRRSSPRTVPRRRSWRTASPPSARRPWTRSPSGPGLSLRRVRRSEAASRAGRCVGLLIRH